MITLAVPNMSCGHCKAAVEAALSGVPGAGHISVDLTAKLATVEGSAALPDLLTALDAAGYPAKAMIA